MSFYASDDELHGNQHRVARCNAACQVDQLTGMVAAP
jgi:hypothetical protein